MRNPRTRGGRRVIIAATLALPEFLPSSLHAGCSIHGVSAENWRGARDCDGRFRLYATPCGYIIITWKRETCFWQKIRSSRARDVYNLIHPPCQEDVKLYNGAGIISGLGLILIWQIWFLILFRVWIFFSLSFFVIYQSMIKKEADIRWQLWNCILCIQGRKGIIDDFNQDCEIMIFDNFE